MDCFFHLPPPWGICRRSLLFRTTVKCLVEGLSVHLTCLCQAKDNHHWEKLELLFPPLPWAICCPQPHPIPLSALPWLPLVSGCPRVWESLNLSLSSVLSQAWGPPTSSGFPTVEWCLSNSLKPRTLPGSWHERNFLVLTPKWLCP